jgi:ornithine cyclodeaminase/alanine dehydrogenase-like protein (mu-crystallin family)
VKTAGLGGDHPRYAAKINANFPANPARHGLPTIQGVVALQDAADGRLLALMDSGELTALRTAAATAVAAKYLARPDSATVAIIGCGLQGRYQLRALRRVLPLRRVLASDDDRDAARAYAAEVGAGRDIEVVPAADHRSAARGADVIVTCTPSRTPVLSRADVDGGTFVAGVGADSEDKSELAPDLLAASTVVTDVLDQCARIGDLHHALAAGAMRIEDVHAELAQVVSGRRAGRTRADEVTVFDSTGTALEDVAAAVAVYERGLAEGAGLEVQLGD